MSCFQLCTIINEGWGRLVCHRLQHKCSEGVQHLLSSAACSNAFALVALKRFQRPDGATQKVCPSSGRGRCNLNAREEHHRAASSRNGGPCAKPGRASRGNDQLPYLGQHLLGTPPFLVICAFKLEFFSQSKARSRCRNGDAEASVGSSFPWSDCADFGWGVESFFSGQREILQFVSP